MKADIEAGNEINQLFQRLEIPSKVQVSAAQGKYVCASRTIPAETVLLEEQPIASWPAPNFSAILCGSSSALPHISCSICFRLRSYNETSEKCEWQECEYCAASFCSASCRGLPVHALLCGAAKRVIHDYASTLRHPSGASCGSTEITVEALARCAAWLVGRIGAVLQQSQLTAEAFSCEDKASGGEASVLNLEHQVFTAAASPLNRLVAAPDSTEYAGVDKKKWFQVVREALACTAPDYLNKCVGRGADAMKEGEAKEPSEAGVPPVWYSSLLSAAVSDRTLNTLLGQMSLNAHGINGLVVVDEQPVWVAKGAGLYSLLSCFNHSCTPNVEVNALDDTHELQLRVPGKVVGGEALTISYIPLTEAFAMNKETFTAEEKAKVKEELAQRQELLKKYFFECSCKRCTKEKALVASWESEKS